MSQRWAYIGMSESEARAASWMIGRRPGPEHCGREMRGQPVTGYVCDCGAQIVKVSDEEAARLAEQGAIDLRD